MPELPEVESVRRALAPVLEGERIVHVELRHPRTGRRNVRPEDVVDRLQGRRVMAVGRQGKFLLAPLDSGAVLVIHLGMSGHVELARPGDPERPHTHFVARTAAGDEMRLVDPRTFGFVAVLEEDELGTIERIGPDALETLPSAARLAERLAGRRAPIKSLLLDQRLLAGLGNIYADEVLHRARIRPDRPGGSLSREEVVRLRRAILPILRAGIAAGGTSLSDLAYLLPDGAAGEFTDRLRVYGREGERCRRCGGEIQRVVLGGRSSFFCPGCQA
jgi:formamidopyrimidine-DNA glycosylase